MNKDEQILRQFTDEQIAIELFRRLGVEGFFLDEDEQEGTKVKFRTYYEGSIELITNEHTGEIEEFTFTSIP